MQFLAQYADWVYLVAAILFILALKGLSSPLGASMGNRYGMIGMLLSVLITFAVAPNPNIALIVGAIAAGAVIGGYRAKTVEMTAMPETVALMHSLVGLAAVLIAIAAVFHEGAARWSPSLLNCSLAALSVRSPLPLRWCALPETVGQGRLQAMLRGGFVKAGADCRWHWR